VAEQKNPKHDPKSNDTTILPLPSYASKCQDNNKEYEYRSIENRSKPINVAELFEQRFFFQGVIGWQPEKVGWS
jgi:hypothetical protein